MKHRPRTRQVTGAFYEFFPLVLVCADGVHLHDLDGDCTVGVSLLWWDSAGQIVVDMGGWLLSLGWSFMWGAWMVCAAVPLPAHLMGVTQ